MTTVSQTSDRRKGTKHASTSKRSFTVRKAERTGWMFMMPFCVLFLLVFVIPIFYAIYASFYRQVASGGGLYGGGDLTNEFVGFKNFHFVLTSNEFWRSIGRVLLYTVVQVPFMIISALILAMLLDSYILKRITIFRLGYFLPFAIPGVVAAIIWVFLYNPQFSPFVRAFAHIGININFFGVNVRLFSMANITTWTFTGYNMLIFMAALQAIPHDLYEAARIDGANGWQIATRIKLPNVRGAALLAMLLSIIGTIQLFNEPQIMQAADSTVPGTYTPMMMALNTSRRSLTPGGDGPASAIAIVMAIIAGLLALGYALAERKVND